MAAPVFAGQAASAAKLRQSSCPEMRQGNPALQEVLNLEIQIRPYCLLLKQQTLFWFAAIWVPGDRLDSSVVMIVVM